MLKKLGLSLLALMLASVLFIGCDSGSTVEPPPGGEDVGFESDLGAFTLNLVDNFQYGDGYQGKISKAELLDGHKILTGDEFTLEITFTVSRSWEAGDDDLEILFADTTQNAGGVANSYWNDLTEPVTIPAAELIEGETITKTLEMIAISDSTGTSVAANDLIFQFESDSGTPGTQNSGTNPATLTFTSFVLIYNGNENAGGEEEVEGFPFELDLSLENLTATSNTLGTAAIPTAGATSTFEDGVLTSTFTENQRLMVKLSAEQIALLQAHTGSIYITIEGEATPDSAFRYHLADPAVGSEWNATNSFDAQAFSAMAAEKEITFASNKSAATLSNFVLQLRAAAETTTTISSIKISAGASGEPEPEPEMVTISFDLQEGTGEADDVEIEKGASLTALPADPTRDGFVFIGWFDAATGGTAVTVTTTFDEDTEVFAQWQAVADEGTPMVITYDPGFEGAAPIADKDDAIVGEEIGDLAQPPNRPFYAFAGWFFGTEDTPTTAESTFEIEQVTLVGKWTFVGGTPALVDGDLVHEFPLIAISPGGTHSTWSGTENDDGSFTVSTGGIRYSFEALEEAGFDIDDYDFFEIEVTLADANNLVLKQFANGSDFMPFSGGGQYPSGDSLTRTFAVREATGGVTIQKHSAGTGESTIQFTKVTFTQGDRGSLTLDSDDADDADEIDGDHAFVVGLPLNLPTPEKDGFAFKGWEDEEGNAIANNAAATEDHKDITLIATWDDFVALDPLTFDFSDVTFALWNATVSDEDEDSFTMNLSNWGGYVVWEIELPEGVSLAQYDKVSFRIEASGAGTTYKNGNFIAGTTFTQAYGYLSDAAMTTHDGNNFYAGADDDHVLTIDKAKATMTGTFFIGVHMNAADGASYKISNFSIAQDD